MNFKRYLVEGKTVQFTVYEVSHGDDADRAVELLKKAGCTNVRIVGTNYDGEVMHVRCDLPDDCKSVDDLARKEPDLIL